MKRLQFYEQEYFNIRSISDRRKKVDKVIVSYIEDNTGHEYRKGYEFPVGTTTKEKQGSIPKIID